MTQHTICSSGQNVTFFNKLVFGKKNLKLSDTSPAAAWKELTHSLHVTPLPHEQSHHHCLGPPTSRFGSITPIIISLASFLYFISNFARPSKCTCSSQNLLKYHRRPLPLAQLPAADSCYLESTWTFPACHSVAMSTEPPSLSWITDLKIWKHDTNYTVTCVNLPPY